MGYRQVWASLRGPVSAPGGGILRSGLGVV
jgi:hypothetical protein